MGGPTWEAPRLRYRPGGKRERTDESEAATEGIQLHEYLFGDNATRCTTGPSTADPGGRGAQPSGPAGARASAG